MDKENKKVSGIIQSEKVEIDNESESTKKESIVMNKFNINIFDQSTKEKK
ncbi:hypothetical protein [Lihuaxuella thermophila]|uniref:Uncharacterized protein n=1 Tax=Lihuaxuella thermophila TaxID=1173111 RepID=A0A1H8DWF8_9BACL|nr:hypothetical protein [Lihuaxuella thermophila]SEN11631.1 hypothetical protein SAMN05444955_10614 [Lihuaxuella thermophila]